MLNNAELVNQLNYIEFIRDIADILVLTKCLQPKVYKLRLEKGLNFVEFNYMLLQAYDFSVSF